MEILGGKDLTLQYPCLDINPLSLNGYLLTMKDHKEHAPATAYLEIKDKFLKLNILHYHATKQCQELQKNTH